MANKDGANIEFEGNRFLGFCCSHELTILIFLVLRMLDFPNEKSDFHPPEAVSM